MKRSIGRDRICMLNFKTTIPDFFTVRLGALVRRGWKKEREEYTDRPKKKKKN